MKPPPFAYHAPEDLDEALRILAELGDSARPLAGGQSLMPLLNLRLARPTAIVDLNRIPALAYHRLDEHHLVVGALCRHRDIERDEVVLRRCQAIADAVPLIGHVGIRNRGTVLGSLAHADPSAEWPILAVLLEAELVIRDSRGSRTVAADDFFLGVFTTVLQTAELLVEARFRMPRAGEGTAFVELARRHGDFALGAAAAVVKVGRDGTVLAKRLVLGGFDTTARLVTPDPGAVAAEVNPTDDIHAPASYRKKLASILATRALALAERRAREVLPV